MNERLLKKKKKKEEPNKNLYSKRKNEKGKFISMQEGYNIIILKFPYDQKIIEMVKSIPGRKFLHESKEWTIPKEKKQERKM